MARVGPSARHVMLDTNVLVDLCRTSRHGDDAAERARLAHRLINDQSVHPWVSVAIATEFLFGVPAHQIQAARELLDAIDLRTDDDRTVAIAAQMREASPEPKSVKRQGRQCVKYDYMLVAAALRWRCDICTTDGDVVRIVERLPEALRLGLRVGPASDFIEPEQLEVVPRDDAPRSTDADDAAEDD